MVNEQKRIQKQIKNLSQSINGLEPKGKNFLELSKMYQCNRKRIHKEILRKYSDLFAILENIRALSVLGIQNLDVLVQKHEIDFRHCIRRYQVLKPVMIKYRDVFDEIICLVENGFTGGAMQRWRTFFEYSIIIMFILQQGELVADEYDKNFVESLKDDLRPRTNLAWAKTADCLKEEKQISIKVLLKNLHGIDEQFKEKFLDFYKLVSQSIHGSPVGVSMSFNNYISEEINDLDKKHVDYFKGGISTVISFTTLCLFQTYIMFFNTFPDGGVEIKSLWKRYMEKYAEVFKSSGF